MKKLTWAGRSYRCALLVELQLRCSRLMFWRKAGGWVGGRAGGRMLAYVR